MPAVVKFKNPPRRDLINTQQYDLLTGPWRVGKGRIHPDDPDLDLDGFLAIVRQAVGAR